MKLEDKERPDSAQRNRSITHLKTTSHDHDQFLRQQEACSSGASQLSPVDDYSRSSGLCGSMTNLAATQAELLHKLEDAYQVTTEES